LAPREKGAGRFDLPAIHLDCRVACGGHFDKPALQTVCFRLQCFPKGANCQLC
jgi:hypothetical protein